MRKFLLLFIYLFIIFGCDKKSNKENYVLLQHKQINPIISVINGTSILKNSSNTDFIINILDAYEKNGYKSTISINNDSLDNFTLYQGDSSGGYMFALRPNKKEIKTYSINITISDDRKIILEKNNILLNALLKLQPYIDNKPLLDTDIIEIKNGENKTIIFNSNNYEYNYIKNNNSWEELYSVHNPAIKTYGWDNIKDKKTDLSGFKVDDKRNSFIINGKRYNNCITTNAISTSCAISISYNGKSTQKTKFIMFLQGRYLPSIINLKGISN